VGSRGLAHYGLQAVHRRGNGLKRITRIWGHRFHLGCFPDTVLRRAKVSRTTGVRESLVFASVEADGRKGSRLVPGPNESVLDARGVSFAAARPGNADRNQRPGEMREAVSAFCSRSPGGRDQATHFDLEPSFSLHAETCQVISSIALPGHKARGIIPARVQTGRRRPIRDYGSLLREFYSPLRLSHHSHTFSIYAWANAIVCTGWTPSCAFVRSQIDFLVWRIS